MAGVKRVRRGRVNAGDSSNEIEGTLSEIRKRFGDNTVTPGSSVIQPDRVSTGIFMLDFCLLGGIPMSRASMIVGEKHAGKSLLACKIAAGAQERYPDQQVVYVDVEGTLDTVWAAKLGVDLDSLLVVQPETGESAIDMTDALIHTKEVSLVVIDSIAALAPMKEIEDSAEDAHVGLQARLVGGMIRKATSGMIAERKRAHEVALLFINQYRCLAKDTWVWTNRGLLPLEEVCPGDFVESPSGFSRVTAVVDSGVLPGRAVRVHRHGTIHMSDTHRHMVVGADGLPVAKRATSLSTEDWVVLAGSVQIPEGISVEEGHASLLGAYFADGCITKSKNRSDYRMSFTEVDEERGALVRRLLTSEFTSGSYGRVLSTVGSEAVAFVDRYGAGYKGVYKVVPTAVRQSCRSDMAEFLRTASFDTHGFLRNHFLWTFETERQAACVSSMLRGFGVYASAAPGAEGRFTYLDISADDAVAFRDAVGFAESNKQVKAAEFSVCTTGARGRYDVVPPQVLDAVFGRARRDRISGLTLTPGYVALSQCAHAGLNASRVRLLRFAEHVATVPGADSAYYQQWADRLRNSRYAQIASVSSCIVDACDIEVEGGLFYADGVLTHNSKIGGYSPYGEAKSIPGGKALEFSTSVQIVVKNKENSGKDDRGVDAVSENEHTFQITKNKLNAGVRAGEFRVRRMPHAEYGLDEGAIDDASTMLAFAKKFGVYTGGGSSWTLEFWDESRKFKGMNDAVISLYEDPELRMALRNYLIYEQAKSLNMPDDFLERFL